MKGKVYLIGAGPGDVGLITVKGRECIREAQSVVYDNLVNEELLTYARQDARLFYAGKKGGEHFLKQEEINELLLAEARQGLTVARLKGGDPFIFGRGGEEAMFLKEHGIPFEVVPGVTSAIAAPAYAGIPLTHRDFTSTIAFVTGHESDEKNARNETKIDWNALTKIGTLVFLMGVKNLNNIVSKLIANGKDAHTPAALIRQGTSCEQTTLVAELGSIHSLAQTHNLQPPALLVVGEVVTLREHLNWFERKPLLGKGVLLTRPLAQARELARLLSAQGARPLYFPVIKIEPADDFAPLDKAIGRLSEYSWIIFTSANGVRYFWERLFALGKDTRALGAAKVAAIGPMTARAMERFGLRVDLTPANYLSEGVVEAMSSEDLQGKKVLLPRAAVARDIIPRALGERGAMVDVVTAYQTVTSGRTRTELEALFASNAIDVVTVTSPSTVEHFLALAGGWNAPARVKTACIGPITAQAMFEHGVPIDIRQDVYTVPALAQAIAAYYQR
jgi:uroporphyrinogen III methyltransferase/synthase